MDKMTTREEIGFQETLDELTDIVMENNTMLHQICVWFFEAQWLGLWMPCLFLIGAGYVQPEGWLGKATNGKWVFLAESTCYLSLMGAMFYVYLSM